MKHELKIWPQFFEPVVGGQKTFEIRKNDRGFQNGDVVILREWDPTTAYRWPNAHLPPDERPKGYTGRSIEFMIGYVMPVDNERVVFSLLRKDSQKK